MIRGKTTKSEKHFKKQHVKIQSYISQMLEIHEQFLLSINITVPRNYSYFNVRFDFSQSKSSNIIKSIKKIKDLVNK